MKSAVLSILFILVSFSANAGNYRDTCLTNGECQDKYDTELGQKCLLVKTGLDSIGNPTCQVRCYSVSLGSYCEKPSGYQVGFCKREKYDQPVFDPVNPDCSTAIDPLSM